MGRSEKYANVLNDDLKENSDVILSSTREIKFKDIYSEIEEIEKEPTKEIIVRKKNDDIELEKEKIRLEKQETFMTKGDLFADLMNKKEKIDSVNKLNDNDISITQVNCNDDYNNDDFVDSKKHNWTIIFVLIVAIGLVSYFFIYPLVKNVFIIDATDVFNKKIAELDKFFINYYDYSNYDDVLVSYDIVNKVSDKDYDVEYSFGKNGISYINSYSSGDSNINYFKLNDNYYLNYNNDNILYNLNNDDFSNVISYLNNDFNKFNDDFKRLLSFENEFVKDNIINSYTSRKTDKITIGDKEYYVYQNSLSISGEKILDSISKNKEEIINNDELIETFNNLFDTDIDSYFDNLVSYLNINNNDNICINIYTDFFNNTIGFDLEKNGFRSFYLYKDTKDNFDLYINLNDFTDFKDYLGLNNNIELIGKRNGNNIDGTIKNNNEEIGALNISNFTNDNVSFEFSYLNNDINYEGNFDFMMSDDSYSINYINKYNDNEVKYNYSYKINKNYNIDLDSYNKVDYNNDESMIKNFNNNVNNNYNNFNYYYSKFFGFDY